MVESSATDAALPPEGAALVTTRHLVKVFGKTRALDDVSMEVNAGETFVLIGPNCNRNTTLKRTQLGKAAPHTRAARRGSLSPPARAISPSRGPIPGWFTRPGMMKPG